MKIIGWIIKLLVFVALVVFALGNTEPITVGLYGREDLRMTAPAVIFLLSFMALGVLIGLAFAAPRLFARGREVSRLKKELEYAQRTGASVEERQRTMESAPARGAGDVLDADPGHAGPARLPAS